MQSKAPYLTPAFCQQVVLLIEENIQFYVDRNSRDFYLLGWKVELEKSGHGYKVRAFPPVTTEITGNVTSAFFERFYIGVIDKSRHPVEFFQKTWFPKSVTTDSVPQVKPSVVTQPVSQPTYITSSPKPASPPTDKCEKCRDHWCSKCEGVSASG